MPPRRREAASPIAIPVRQSPRKKRPAPETTSTTSTPSPPIAKRQKNSIKSQSHTNGVREKKSPKPKPPASTHSDGAEETSTPKRKRKTKEEKEADNMPLAARSAGLKMYIGAHVSGAQGVQNAITNTVHIGGNAFALFLKSQRKWDNPPLKPENISMFKDYCSEHHYDSERHILPHGSYLVNLAQPEPDKAAQAYGSFVEDLQRCESLGIGLYNFHPGNTCSQPRPEALKRIAKALNKAHAATSSVVTVLENMAGTNNVIGGTFEDLRDIIKQVDNKSRVGVCLDTCHAHAAGYALDSPEKFKKTIGQFDDVIGINFLKALHLNDSKAPFASHRDLHQNIGVGFLGLRAFHSVMNEPRFHSLPMVLETPNEKKGADGKVKEDKAVWANEIKLLESLIGMDADSAEFKELEKQLADKGQDDRAKFQEAHSKKKAKEAKSSAGDKASKGAMSKWLKGKEGKMSQKENESAK
ncbi:MAG: hypothetical protein M1814_001822 [Vezdaea aestivalis]|nr:MAG: hypothetical protein M1814_001822 [Vezdaea aestivalis]